MAEDPSPDFTAVWRSVVSELNGDAGPGGEAAAEHPVSVLDPPLNPQQRAWLKLVQPLTDAQLAFLAANDNDPFNRWDALQRLYQKALLEQVR